MEINVRRPWERLNFRVGQLWKRTFKSKKFNIDYIDYLLVIEVGNGTDYILKGVINSIECTALRSLARKRNTQLIIKNLSSECLTTWTLLGTAAWICGHCKSNFTWDLAPENTEAGCWLCYLGDLYES